MWEGITVLAALIQHGDNDKTYKQAMRDQFGDSADKYLDAFREKCAIKLAVPCIL